MYYTFDFNYVWAGYVGDVVLISYSWLYNILFFFLFFSLIALFSRIVIWFSSFFGEIVSIIYADSEIFFFRIYSVIS